jgi:hypothetical protein
MHPDGDRLARLLDPVVTDHRMIISTGHAMSMRATIRTPSRLRELT